MEKIFFDSSALIAIFNERDDNHKIAVDFFHHLIENGVYLFTTDYILDETFTMLKLRAGYIAFLCCHSERSEESFKINYFKTPRFARGDKMGTFAKASIV
jgi:predicted nucleic acid-binding protein